MFVEELSLACGYCGAVTVKSIDWVQAHRVFRCERCGRSSKLDKDRLSLVLAGRRADSEKKN